MRNAGQAKMPLRRRFGKERPAKRWKKHSSGGRATCHSQQRPGHVRPRSASEPKDPCAGVHGTADHTVRFEGGHFGLVSTATSSDGRRPTEANHCGGLAGIEPGSIRKPKALPNYRTLDGVGRLLQRQVFRLRARAFRRALGPLSWAPTGRLR